CRHLTALNRAVVEKRLEPPPRRADLALLRDLGEKHERAYLTHLEAQGLRLSRPPQDHVEPETAAIERTLAAMKDGVDVIVQAALVEGRWLGRADVLRRVERSSLLGAWSYEVYDTKLALETRGGSVLQLCLYSDLLAGLQGVAPERMHIVPPRPEFPPESYRVADYAAYYRRVRRQAEDAVDLPAEGAVGSGAAGAPVAPGSTTGAAGSPAAPTGAATVPPSYPLPVAHCDICMWWKSCDDRRRADDHLSLVASISKLQTRELESRGIKTLAGLAEEPIPLSWRPKRGAKETYERAREQARVQLEGRRTGDPVHEWLPLEEGRGLTLVPRPSAGDVFLDLEGDPFAGQGGQEYLFGWAALNENGEPMHYFIWALDRSVERIAFEVFIDEVMARWQQYPDMHVYHYAAYEPAALKRLMGRHATRESEIDGMLRAGLFVDLHTVVRQSMRASVEEYSIKRLEPVFGYERTQSLLEASVRLRVVQRALELGSVDAIDKPTRKIVEAYNRDDCMSAMALRDWLEHERTRIESGGIAIPRPIARKTEVSEELGERDAKARHLANTLLTGMPADPDRRSSEQRAIYTLANLLEFHRREEKAPWWEYFDLQRKSDEELLEESAGLSGLAFVERVGGTAKAPVDRYRFPKQETSIRADHKLHAPLPDGREVGDVERIDLAAGTIDIKKRMLYAEEHPHAVFSHKMFSAPKQAESLMRLGGWVADHGLTAPGPFRAARDLLLRLPPRVDGGAGGDLRLPGESGIDAARRVVVSLDHTVLGIQGPPGSGKTVTGARMILDLVALGRKVGVCAGSHEVIRNLLEKVVAAGEADGVRVRCVQKPDEMSEDFGPIREVRKNEEVLAALTDGLADVVGGTAWLWSRPEFAESVDVLFVDEAGQMALANVLAIAQAAKSVVLLGDPRQLEHPVKGSHPDGTAVSALEHLLDGEPTIPPDRGIFLEETWRLHPTICGVTSELFYASRLRSKAGLERQGLAGGERAGEAAQVGAGVPARAAVPVPAFKGAGVWFVPVQHDGCRSSSPEEVKTVRSLVRTLTGGGGEGARWIDMQGVERPLTLEDVLIVAPYNAQVADLSVAIPGARVGTVDKFQGQEAPVVIYSMTTSSPEDVPRGMEFFYSPNRINVATSRARCACILVGSPRLFGPECQTPRHMLLANAFCRFQEAAGGVNFAATQAAPVS
ncbi:MAG TPA: TM0106 family RecB-like putative nuclease, partial [Candidatus Eisenbacteria bacterium]|nr:TM0106 family RecB-like putative nuclease [Candidatus Eisenbacteria bacterium]